MAEKLILIPERVVERVYRAIIALPTPLGVELAEATEELYKNVREPYDGPGCGRPQ